MAVHGHPRYTKDLDVWIECAEVNARRVVEALESFGFGSLGLRPEDFLERDQVIQLGYPPNRIGVLTSASGLEFGKSYQRRVTIVIDETSVDFVGIDDLVQNKRSTGRYQDLADIEALGE